MYFSKLIHAEVAASAPTFVRLALPAGAPDLEQRYCAHIHLPNFALRMAVATVVEAETAEAVTAQQTPLEAALLARARPSSYSSPFEQEMAAAREQLGGDLINLASGDPDLPTPAYITAAAVTAIEDGQHHYTPKNGLPALRDAISFHLERTIGMTYKPDEICATAGVQEAMISCFLALTAAGQFPACPPPLSFRSVFAHASLRCYIFNQAPDSFHCTGGQTQSDIFSQAPYFQILNF